jgi:hypothetical protein
MYAILLIGSRLLLDCLGQVAVIVDHLQDDCTHHGREMLLQINLRGFVTRITDTVSFSSPVSTADFCFPSGHWEHAASLHCSLGDDTKLQKKLPYKQASLSGQPDDVSCVTVELPEPYALPPSHAPLLAVNYLSFCMPP